MNRINLKDGNRQIKTVCEELRAVCSVIMTIGDHPEYDNANEALAVIERALTPIIADLEDVVQTFDAELNEETVPLSTSLSVTD